MANKLFTPERVVTKLRLLRSSYCFRPKPKDIWRGESYFDNVQSRKESIHRDDQYLKARRIADILYANGERELSGKFAKNE